MTEHAGCAARPPGTTNSMRDGVLDIERRQKERDRKDSNQQRGNVDDH